MNQSINENRSRSVMVFALVCLMAVAMGWFYKDQTFLRADRGTGYYLGIAGGIMMLLLLIYPLRKHIVFMRGMGPVKPYFILHMMLGVIGPILILFHANFSLGSTNSNVALFAMLLVVASGLIGRFLYQRIHAGLSSQRRTMNYLEQRLHKYEGDLSKLLRDDSSILMQLKTWETKVRQSMGEQRVNMLYLIFILPFSARMTSWRLRKMVKKQKNVFLQSGIGKHRAKRSLRLLRRFVRYYVRTLLAEGQLRVYERMFSWWHIIHLPIFILLVLSAIFHIVAVHIY